MYSSKGKDKKEMKFILTIRKQGDFLDRVNKDILEVTEIIISDNITKEKWLEYHIS